MFIRNRARDEQGAVLIVVALVMSALLILTAGGIVSFTLYGANRELQRAADQAALAGAAALPPLNPGVVANNFPVVPGLDTAYNLAGNAGLNIPRLGSLVPDPRAVACSYGHDSLSPGSARLINSFGAAPASPGPTVCAQSPWNDNRIIPTLVSTDLAACVQNLVGAITARVNTLLGPVSGLLGVLGVTAVVNQVLAPVNGLVADLERLAPAVLTPKMTVQVRSAVNPPLFSIASGGNGIQMTVTATAQRRLKNAVVVPTTPGVPLTGLNFNTELLSQTRGVAMSTLDQVNTQLNNLMSQFPATAGCQNVLSQVRTDIGDIYNPPSSGVGQDLINAAVAATQSAAGRAGVTTGQLAGEAFYVIGAGPTPSTLASLVGPLSLLVQPLLAPLLNATQIPTLDVAIIAAHNLAPGSLISGGKVDPTKLISDAVQARGLFQATLVKP